ncbi:MAG: hypothetical protein L0387_38505 [Acidobacteria bacterium]|nr:hypothetical protein [Acidobacteriota bacterium]MCI0724386.1 hypothetical protein [Acidobacteriota bacterium]
MLDRPLKESLDALQLVVDGFLTDLDVHRPPPQPAKTPIVLGSLRLSGLQFRAQREFSFDFLLGLGVGDLSGESLPFVILEVKRSDVPQQLDPRVEVVKESIQSLQDPKISAGRGFAPVHLEVLSIGRKRFFKRYLSRS